MGNHISLKIPFPVDKAVLYIKYIVFKGGCTTCGGFVSDEGSGLSTV
jgi:hypothetical protein